MRKQTINVTFSQYLNTGCIFNLFAGKIVKAAAGSVRRVWRRRVAADLLHHSADTLDRIYCQNVYVVCA